MANRRLEAALANLDAARADVAAALEDVGLPAPGAVLERPLLLRFTEAAEHGGLSRSAIFELVRSRQLPAVEVPGVGRRIRRADLEQWVEGL